MLAICEEIVKRTSAGERVALCVVVRTKGSCPQSAGAKMLLLVNGQQLGTLGGGCVEAEVKKKAIELLLEARSQAFVFRLDHDYGWDDGLICGGVMEIAVQTIDSRTAEQYGALAVQLRRDAPTRFELPYRLEDAELTYVEELGPTPTLLIAGAGHVGQALGALMSNLDFHIDVIDDRADLTSAERFPHARQRIVGDMETELSRYPVDPSTYVVIVTRGHRHDGRALQAVIDSPARYIGLIGSKAKIKTIFSSLHQQGVAIEKLLKVQAPIGLEIGAVTETEIALSIAAELVAVRHGRENLAAGPMKMDQAGLEQWLKVQ
jgi:xanthine dehydrogenase accessory factor